MKWPKVFYLILCAFIFTDILFFVSLFMCRPFLYCQCSTPLAAIFVSRQHAPPFHFSLVNISPSLDLQRMAAAGRNGRIDSGRASTYKTRIEMPQITRSRHPLTSPCHLRPLFTFTRRNSVIMGSATTRTRVEHKNLNERIGTMPSAPTSYSGSMDTILNPRLALRHMPILSPRPPPTPRSSELYFLVKFWNLTFRRNLSSPPTSLLSSR